MKFSIATTLLALLPAMGWSCSVYDSCRCGNDGVVNEAATKSACARYAGHIIRNNDGIYCAAGVINAGSAGGQVLSFNNCKFRDACNAAGSHGDSQWCFNKSF